MGGNSTSMIFANSAAAAANLVAPAAATATATITATITATVTATSAACDCVDPRAVHIHIEGHDKR